MKDKNNKENAKKRDHEKEMEEFKKRIFEDLNEQTRRIRDLEAREAAGEKPFFSFAEQKKLSFSGDFISKKVND